MLPCVMWTHLEYLYLAFGSVSSWASNQSFLCFLWSYIKYVWCGNSLHTMNYNSFLIETVPRNSLCVNWATLLTRWQLLWSTRVVHTHTTFIFLPHIFKAFLNRFIPFNFSMTFSFFCGFLSNFFPFYLLNVFHKKTSRQY